MVEGHDFVRFPELTNSQMNIYYFDSPHTQITGDFDAEVVKVHDGDTVTLRWNERDFDFPLRFRDTAAPELDEPGGSQSQSWLEAQLLGKEVRIEVDPFNRVEKWGRLLGNVILEGQNMGLASINEGHSRPWNERKAGDIPDFDKVVRDFGS